MVSADRSSISFEPKSVQELSYFFKANKNTYREIWVVLTKKKHVGHQPVSFPEAISEAVKQGLIDSRTKTLSEQKYAVRFTKRKTKASQLSTLV